MKNSNYHIVHQYISDILPQVERPPEGKILFPWLSVSCGMHYGSTIFTWDYHHAAMRFAIAGRPEYLRYLVDNLMVYQQPDGNTPNVVHVETGPRFLDMPFHAQPFLFQSAFLYVSQTGDTAWGESVFEKLVKYLKYYDKGYTGAFGLKRWRVGWMGGLDNDVVTAFLPPDTIASCDVNAWYYIELLAAAKLAKLLERSEETSMFARSSKVHREIVNDKLWYDEMKSYSAFSLCDGAPHFSLSFDNVPAEIGKFAFQSCSNLIPLYARMADAGAASEMIKTYVINEKHFWSPHGIRSLSAASEYYNNAVFGNPSRFGDHRRMEESNWQGPVWVPNNYFTFQALRHYGFTKEAGILADRTVDVLANCLKTQGSFSENFNSETGKPLYATHFASWNLLADTMHDDLESGNWIMDTVFS